MASVGQIISMLDEAEREIPAVKQLGDQSVAMIREAVATLRSVSDGIPNSGLVGQIEAQSAAIEKSFTKVMGLKTSIKRVKDGIPDAFAR